MCFDTGPSDAGGGSSLSPLAPTALPGEGANPGAVTANQTPVSTPSVLETAGPVGDVADVTATNAALRGDDSDSETRRVIADQIAQARGGGVVPIGSGATDPLGGSSDETAGARALETAEMSGANYFTRELAVGQSHPPSSMTGKGSLDYTMQRYNLPGDVASSIAFNPMSRYSTGGEKALAGAQIVLPGGFLLGGARALGMTGGRSSSGAGDAPDESYDFVDASTPPLKSPPKKIIPRPVAPKVSQKKSPTLASALPKFPEGSTVPFPQFRGQSSLIASPRFRGSLDDEEDFGISRLRLGGIA